MSFTCRQCELWNPTGELTREQAVKHLVDMHGTRAKTLLLKLEASGPTPPTSFDAMLDQALSHRSEFNNAYGVYE